MDKNKLLLGIMISVVGLLMLLSPEAFIKFAVIILGVAAVIDGIFILATTRNLILDPLYNKIVLIRGSLSILVGIIAIVIPNAVLHTLWGAMAYTLGGYLVASAAMQVFTIAKLHRNGIMIRQSVIEVIMSLLLAALLFLIATKQAQHVITYIFGTALLLFGLGMIALVWRTRAIVEQADAVATLDDDGNPVAPADGAPAEPAPESPAE